LPDDPLLCVMAGGFIMAAVYRVHSSRLWALFHLNLTQLLFPERMILDDGGVSLVIIRYWLTPWKKIDENVFFANIADEKLSTGLLLASIQVANASGGDPLLLDHVWKWPARRFVNEVRKRKSSRNQPGP
jgi:hypothetical protein